MKREQIEKLRDLIQSEISYKHSEENTLDLFYFKIAEENDKKWESFTRSFEENGN